MNARYAIESSMPLAQIRNGAKGAEIPDSKLGTRGDFLLHLVVFRCTIGVSAVTFLSTWSSLTCSNRRWM
jgi:hypothetical protein